MKLINTITTLLLFLIFSTGYTQNFTISGNVKSNDDGEDLIGSTIYVKELKTGTITNLYGFYSISLPEGKYTLQYSYIGFQTYTTSIELTKDMNLNVELETASIQMQEVEITGEVADENIRSSEMSMIKLSPKETKLIPVIMGEQDVLKTIQLLPGVSTGSEGSTGIYVRGGGADQNLIVLDEAPIYNASHLMGFFSVFNSDAIKDVELYKGSAPAEYGGRLSSVIDIKMKDGNSKKFSASGGLGLISSRLTLEAPIVKDKGSVIVSARRTYADIFTVFAKNRTSKNTDLFFYDLNLKANYEINKNNRIFLSGYYGRDVFNIEDLFSLKWGNNSGTLRWNHIFGNKLFLNSTLTHSKYNYGFGYKFSEDLIYLKSGITDINWKEDFQYYINVKNTLKFGFNAIHHTFNSGELESGNNESFNSIFLGKKRALEGALYISHQWEISPLLNMTYGFRFSNYITTGPDTLYTYNDNDDIINTETFSKGEVASKYGNLEPRININYIINNKNSVKISWSRNVQYIHLLSNSSASLPTDVWISSSNNVAPQISDQLALGYYRNFNDNMFETSVEAYYKELDNQIDYQNGAQIILNKNIESQLIYGKGRAYGIEFFIKKRTGKLTGWIGYTLSRTEKSMDAIDYGSWYPAKYDRTHDISIVAIYQLNERLNLSATWVYNTGNAVTFPSGKYEVNNFTVPAFTNRNGYRMPDYHRMDIGATYTFKKKNDLNQV